MHKWEILGILVIVSLLCGPAQRLQQERHQKGYLRDCKSSQNDICVALQGYAKDHAGHYPASLRTLVPTYLERLPICPAAHPSQDYNYKTLTGDGFQLGCQGANHISLDVPEGHPVHNHQLGHCERE